MITSGNTINMPLKNMKGFTFLELMIVISMVGIIASIAMVNFIPLKKKALDKTALMDARNLVDSIIIATLGDEDVDFTKINTGGAVGDVDTVGNPRNPVFVLSPGVAALITGDTHQNASGDVTIVLATVYHTDGTADPLTLSGKKEYSILVDESTDIAGLL
ncbi:type II secretion system protein [Desulfobacula sp.]|uniref:type II secretion system protein n=1 Tax=Desulfobacula sp. TaxID=2593537 RepID=UPI00261A9BBD|nr:type II secretion system protein [Desulfobacula sp.]